jgi:hypothetical protein
MRLPVALSFCTALTALLSGCASSEGTFASFLVAPGNYVLFSCDDIARTAKGVEARHKELEKLMAKDSADTGGRIIANATYGTEYAQTRGQLNSLRATAAEKNCDGVPGAGKPAAKASDGAIR